MASFRTTVFARKLGRIAYLPALEAQNAMARRHLDGVKAKNVKNMLLFCEHFPVFTTGIRNKTVDSREKARLEKLGAEFHYTNRGGLVTFHGPGQLLCYPVLNLACFKKSVRWYVACLEKTLVETCGRLDVDATTTCDTGVWVKNNKIAAIGANDLSCSIGVRVSRWVTTHGIALNCNTDLRWFEHITPCGIVGKGVTSLAQETNRNVTVEDVIPLFLKSFQNVFDCDVIEENRETRDEGILSNTCV